MTMANRTRSLVSLLCLAAMTFARAQGVDTAKSECKVEQVKAQVAQVQAQLLPALQGMLSTTRCAALINLLKQIASKRVVIAGRKLEADRAAPPGEAERQLREARENPEIRRAIDIELAGEIEPKRMLLLEAVVMGDKQMLLARDLLLTEIVAGGRP